MIMDIIYMFLQYKRISFLKFVYLIFVTIVFSEYLIEAFNIQFQIMKMKYQNSYCIFLSFLNVCISNVIFARTNNILVESYDN